MLILSLFPGIDLLGRGFEAEGFCVVRGPDLLWGGDIRSFHCPAGKFDGVIAGSPCQDFSKKRRVPATGYGEEMLKQFARAVTEGQPDWWLLENVPTVRDVAIDGYKVQRFDLSARECGGKQLRLRHFQFGSKDGRPLIVERESATDGRRCAVTLEPCCLASEGKKKDRRGFDDFCELQGLPRDFKLPGYSIAAKYEAVGNGVPVYMARVIARAVTDRALWSGADSQIKLCACDCGRVVSGRRVSATSACRKRLQRRRDLAGALAPGQVTANILREA
jgi:DNA (cytosine-5)-methyltransferase 1